jgi:hypothetical protein
MPPAERHRDPGVPEKDEMILRLKDGECRIFTPHQAVQRAQVLLRRYLSDGRLLVDELVMERRTEAKND